MEETKQTMTIGKVEVPVVVKEMKQSELLFYAENPRVFSALRSSGNEHPTQFEIEKKMISLDNVKTLKVSIEANGGLHEPIIVRGKEVLEGNSRLAAYRLLARTDPEKWAYIKCQVLPDDLPEELVLALLGSIHLVGRTDWSPFEKAGYLYRTKLKSRRPIKAIATDLGINVKEAEMYVKVYQMMIDADDMTPTRWSYYYEILKNSHIVKADAKNPELHVIETLIRKIKEDEFDDAKDIRKVANIVKVGTEESHQVLMDFLNDEIGLDDAVEMTSEANVGQLVSAGFDRFRKLLNDHDSYIRQLLKTDTDFHLQMKQLLNTLDGYKLKE